MKAYGKERKGKEGKGKEGKGGLSYHDIIPYHIISYHSIPFYLIQRVDNKAYCTSIKKRREGGQSHREKNPSDIHIHTYIHTFVYFSREISTKSE